MTPVGFVADTHDHSELVDRQVETMRDYGVEEVVHLGDVTTVDTMSAFTSEFEVHWITGNGDEHAKQKMGAFVKGRGGHAHGYNERLVFGEKRFLCRHGIEHSLSYPLAATDDALDYVMHGHYHHQERTVVGNPPDHGGVVFNPGAEGIYVYYPADDAFEHCSFEVDNA